MEESPFKNLFVQLVDLYLKPDWTWDDFAKAQWIQGNVITLHNTNLNSTAPQPITFAEYELLNHMARYLIGEMRFVLNRKDREIHG